MNTQHTPGPWAVKHHEDTDTYSIYVAGRQWNSWTVAALGYSKEDEANARLIAAAPDLLEALQTMLIAFAPPNYEEMDESELETCFPEWTKARAAAAKATGEQP
jgi:hypothetical protein